MANENYLIRQLKNELTYIHNSEKRLDIPAPTVTVHIDKYKTLLEYTIKYLEEYL